MKSIGKRNQYLGPLHIADRILESVMILVTLLLYGQLVDSNTLQSQESGKNNFNIKFSYYFVIVKNSTTNRLIALITNDRGFLIFKISRNRRYNRFFLKYTG